MKELSLNILDITQNSISAGASLITVEVNKNAKENKLTISIADNGKGMSEDFVKHVCDPFVTTRTTRKVGMGIPLLKLASEQAGGRFEIFRKRRKGDSPGRDDSIVERLLVLRNLRQCGQLHSDSGCGGAAKSIESAGSLDIELPLPNGGRDYQ